MDFQWFLTIPGLLISGGVILLIVALIIFISTSNKKGNKVDKVSAESAQGAKEMVDSGMTISPTNDAIGTPGIDMAQSQNVENPNNIGMPAMDAVNPMPETNAPVMDAVSPMPEVSEPVVEATPEIPVANSIDSSQIYGGASPISNIDINSTNNEPHEIYGGANPLENTQINMTPPVSAEVIPEASTPVVPAAENIASAEVTPIVDATANETPIEVAPVVDAGPISESSTEVAPVVETSTNITDPVAPVVDITPNNQ